MQRIVVFSTGIRSDISTDLAIAEKLAQFDFSIVICAHRNGDEARVRANGVEFIHYERQNVNALQAVFDRLGSARDAQQPVLYLCHAELHREQLLALSRDVAVAAIDSHLSVDPRSGVPPLTRARAPGFAARTSSWLHWRRLLMQRYKRPAFRAQIDYLRKLAEELGLDFDAIATFEHWHPVRFKTVPYWCLAARELDFAPGASRSTPHLGPQVSLSLREPQTDSDAYARLRPWIEDPTTLVYCSFGSLLSDQRLLLEVVRAARGRPSVRWLLGVNGLSSIPDLGDLPDNVRVLRDVPQSAVLAHSAAMITGAGIASINECITARVPMLIYSLGVLDQNGNAARVGWHGLGVVGDRISDRANNILSHLDALQSEATATRLRTMAASFAEYEQQQLLPRAVRELIPG